MFGCLPYFTNEANADNLITIDKIYITYTGFLATNTQTLKYTVPSEANYTLSEDDDPKSGWYKDNGFKTIQDFSDSGTNAYKKLTIKPESGYNFASDYCLYINDFPKVMMEQ